jgi:RNA polymerase sigma factor (sigma-70 family)
VWKAVFLISVSYFRKLSVFKILIRSSAKNLQTDEQVLAAFKQSANMDCIEVLFNRYCELVFGVALKYLQNKDESKDAVVDIFEKVPSDLMKYEIKNFSHWIYIVTKNHCFHLLKKRTHNFPVEHLDYHPSAAWKESEEESIDFGQLLGKHLEESLLKLNDAQKTCIRLFYLEEKSYDEIQQITGFNYNQVKSHIQNGKRNLKIYLSKYLKPQ